ncbi:MAG: glycoside hydrolase family 16 protein [Candidatus Sulfotelmatobacter sp.]
MQKLSTVVFLVLGSATLLQAQLQPHNRSRASASLSSISFSAASVVGGDTLIGTVHLTAPAPSEGAVVTLILDDPSDSCVIPVSAQVPTGATSANFAVQTRAVSSNFTVTVLGTYGVTRYASLVVTDAASTPSPTQDQTSEEPSEEPTEPPTFEDNFSEGKLNTSKWAVSNYETNDYAGGGSDVTFSPDNVDLGGGSLRLELTQPTAGTSRGAELTSKLSFGYGTYAFSMRAGSTSPTSSGPGTTESGQISSTFIIHDPPPSYQSVTEIDAPEIEGLAARSNEIEWDVWKNSVSTDPTPEFNVLANPQEGFHHYQFVWAPASIKFYVDGVLKAICTSGIPSVAAVIDINFYGTNDLEWGGRATVGVTRYMYVNSVKFWKR